MVVLASKPLAARPRGLRFAIGAAAFLLASSAAGAADLGPPIAYPIGPTGYSWSGFYAGIQVGYDWGKDSTTEYLTAGMVPLGLVYKYSTKGILGGAHLGYNYQMGNVVLGIEGDFEGSGMKGGFVDEIQNIGLGTMSIEWQGSIRGRIGYAFDRFMLYGTGGWSFANIGYTYTNRLTDIAESTERLRNGWSAGVGAEYAVSQNVTARLEYRHTNYGTFLYDSVTSFPGLTGEQKPRSNAIRGGVSFRF